jgi:hypothetical protein
MFGTPNRIQSIPYIKNFADAKQMYEKTKPIRGRSDGKRPLTDRSAVDNYYMLANEDGSYSCVLYQTKVLTYYADDTVAIDTGTWESQTTRLFIQNILGLGCYRKNQHDVLLLNTYRRVEPFCILGKEPTVVRQGRDSEVWELVKSPVTTEVKLLRKEANAACAKYKEFTDYLKNSMKLRADEDRRVHISADELANAFPEGSPFRKMYWGHMDYKEYNTYKEMGELFFGMAGATSDDKHEKFYHATLLLVANIRGIMLEHASNNPHGAWRITDSGKGMLDKFKELVLKWHSKEVFEITPARAGVVPSPKYKKYVSAE